MLVRAKTGEAIYIVEIKVKPKISHVGALLSIVDLYEMKWGVRPKPVLAGVWIGSEVEIYALKKGVLVYKL